MKRAACISFLFALVMASFFTQPSDFPKLTNPHLGQKPPGMTPEIFAPRIVSSSEALEYGMAFTPDGREFYFNCSGTGVMVCTGTDTGWTAPIKAPFLEKHKGGAVHIMYDGKRLLLNRYSEAHGLKAGEAGGFWSLQKSDADWGTPKFLIKDGMRATSTRDGTIYTTDISGRKAGKDEGIIARYVYTDSDSTYLIEQLCKGYLSVKNSETIEEQLKEVNQKIVFCGHSHLLKIIQTSTRLIVNPGSVGCPSFDDDSPINHRAENFCNYATYCIVEIIDGEALAEQISIPYDYEKAVHCAMTNNRTDWAKRLQTGRV